MRSRSASSPSPVAADTSIPSGWRNGTARRSSGSSRSALLRTSSRGVAPAPISSSTSSTARAICDSSSSGAEASTTWSSRSARRVSSRVAPNASTSWWGSLRMNPTVSVMQVGAAVQLERPGGRVERVEQPVPHPDVGAGQRVEQRGLARVGVAGQRDRRQLRPLALGAHRRAVRAHVAELALERGDAVAGEPAIGLDLRLTGAARSDAAAEALEVRPQAAHAREVVLELGQLDLQLARRPSAACPAKMSRITAVRSTTGTPRAFSRLRSWRGRQLVVAGHHVGVAGGDRGLDLVELPLAQVGVRVRAGRDAGRSPRPRRRRPSAAAPRARRDRRLRGARRCRAPAAWPAPWAACRRCAKGWSVRVDCASLTSSVERRRSPPRVAAPPGYPARARRRATASSSRSSGVVREMRKKPSPLGP